MSIEKFTRARLVWISLSEMEAHPEVQRDFDLSLAKKYRDQFDADKFGTLSVVKDGARYLIWNGQHRAWAARETLGPDQKVPCMVYDDIPVERLAELFLGVNDAKPLRAVDKFTQAVTAKRPNEVRITEILTELGLEVGHNYAVGTIRSPVALMRVYERCGEINLRRALRIICAAWDGDRDALDGVIIRAVGRLLQGFAAEIDDSDLIRKLTRSGGPSRLIGAARDHAKTMGWDIERAATERLLLIYNKGRRTKALTLAQAA